MLWDVWGDSMCVCFMQKTSVAANCRATNVWQLPALCASHLLYACSHEWARSLWTIAVSVRTEHKEKEKKKPSAVFSDMQAILCRVLVQTACLKFFFVCFPLTSKSLVLKSGFEAVSAAFSDDFLNGRLEYHEFQRKHPFWHEENQGQIIEEPLLGSTLSPDNSMEILNI